MSPESVAERVLELEQQMTALQDLPKKVDDLTVRVIDLSLQVSQLRTEMHGEFSAVREEIRAGDEETRRFMRTLHENVIARMAAQQNGRPVPGSRRRRPKR